MLVLLTLGCQRVASDAAVNANVCMEWSHRVSSGWPTDTLTVPDEAMPTGGMALGDSNAFVFDIALGRIVRVDSDSRIVASIGRSGDGPGEFARAHSTSIGFLTRPDWIAVRSDSLFVFDGRSVHLLTADGSRLSQWSVGVSVGAGISTRMRPFGQGVVIDLHKGFESSGGARGVRPNRSFALVRVRPDTTQVFATFVLPPAPVTAQGTIFEGPAEARPQWDVVGRCGVVVDGSSATLTLFDVESGARDTRTLPLPDRFVDAERANASVRFEGMSDGLIPPPTQPKRILELMLDHSGWIWMRPPAPAREPGSGVEIWKYHIPTGRFTIDTVAAFPRLLGATGEALGVATDHQFVTRVIPIAR